MPWAMNVKAAELENRVHPDRWVIHGTNSHDVLLGETASISSGIVRVMYYGLWLAG